MKKLSFISLFIGIFFIGVMVGKYRYISKRVIVANVPVKYNGVCAYRYITNGTWTKGQGYNLGIEEDYNLGVALSFFQDTVLIDYKDEEDKKRVIFRKIP